MLYPYFTFSVCGKCTGMPINKGLNAILRVWKTLEVRYQVPKKIGFRGVRVVSLPTAKSGCTSALTDEKTIFLIDSFSVL